MKFEQKKKVMKISADEFEKKMYFSAYINTLADTVTKMNPGILCSASIKDIEAADLKSQYQGTTKAWLDMLSNFIKKADKIGTSYPIEDILGINNVKRED